MHKRVKRFFVLALVGIALGGVWAAAEMKKTSPSIVTSETKVTKTANPLGGAFALTDHHGKSVTEAAWGDKHKLVFFGFTSCMHICPAALQKISNVLDGLKPETLAKIQPLFITTDPERDDVAAMAEYVGAFHENIIGLTGTRAEIDAVIDAYKVYAAKVKTREGYEIDHSGYVYLMGTDHHLMKIMRNEDEEEEMVKILEEFLGK